MEKHFGAPVNRHPTVGAPPITRWDYNGFSVFFEKDRVIDSVVTANIARRELKPLAAAPLAFGPVRP